MWLALLFELLDGLVMHVLSQLIILIDDDIGLTHRADLMLRMDHGIVHFFSMALFSAFLRFELVTI
jgi:hypothetical protein